MTLYNNYNKYSDCLERFAATHNTMTSSYYGLFVMDNS